MRIFVACHRGMVGSSILRHLEAQGVDTITRTRAELDPTSQADVRTFYVRAQPDAVVVAVAAVGGI